MSGPCKQEHSEVSPVRSKHPGADRALNRKPGPLPSDPGSASVGPGGAGGQGGASGNYTLTRFFHPSSDSTDQLISEGLSSLEIV